MIFNAHAGAINIFDDERYTICLRYNYTFIYVKLIYFEILIYDVYDSIAAANKLHW